MSGNRSLTKILSLINNLEEIENTLASNDNSYNIKENIQKPTYDDFSKNMEQMYGFSPEESKALYNLFKKIEKNTQKKIRNIIYGYFQE